MKFKWLIPIIAHGLTWLLAAKLGMEAAEAETTGAAVAEWAGAGLIIAWSIYDSIKGREAVKDK